jgi:hypothetical protein
MQPRKDYDDYTTFINDTFNEKKVAMLQKSMNEKGFSKKESRTQSSNPYASSINHDWLKGMSQMRNSSTMMSGEKKMHLRNLSHRITTP